MDEFNNENEMGKLETNENEEYFTEENVPFEGEIISNGTEPDDEKGGPIYTVSEETTTGDIGMGAKPKNKKFMKVIAVALIASILGGGSIGMGFGAGAELAKNYLRKSGKSNFSFSGTQNQEGSNIEAETASSAGGASAEFLGGGLSSVVKKIKPSVVSITTTSTQDYSFFGSQDIEGAGSGIIFEEDGEKVYIVTNAHVIQGANSVGVAIGEADAVPAKLVGKDTDADLAVIYVLRADLEKAGIGEVMLAKFGDSKLLEVGDMVLAVGNALGEGSTSTFGMVSALDKIINIEQKSLQVIQTDAAINLGNSGGALVNLDGEVIGINTAKISQEYAEGMGYSISSEIAMPIIEDIMNGSEKAFLGIRGRTLDEQLASQFSLPPAGVLIVSATPGSCAEKAGIIANDIITSFNGKTVFTMENLQEFLGECIVGQSVEVKILRNGTESVVLTVVLDAYSDTAF
ncbi:MAG: trypsin-like peptidase domain-containing protein [Clostridiales bacterium]|jgi:serine protease Do|nr:trypsin-like peptidase domain-containing protein [Clostridiales bacterium]